jgi:hypothetical protein
MNILECSENNWGKWIRKKRYLKYENNIIKIMKTNILISEMTPIMTIWVWSSETIVQFVILNSYHVIISSIFFTLIQVYKNFFIILFGIENLQYIIVPIIVEPKFWKMNMQNLSTQWKAYALINIRKTFKRLC